MSVRSIVVQQFKQPHGPLGSIAGFVMANRPSNIQRNNWTVELLELEPNYRALEIGCGPGLALKACAAELPQGFVVGIDHSKVMVRQARRRLAPEIEAGRAAVQLASLADGMLPGANFDRVYSLNVVQFFPDVLDQFSQIRACLAENGKAVTTFQPRSKNPTREDALAMADRIESAMRAVGFACIERLELPVEPVPAVCVTGRKASAI